MDAHVKNLYCFLGGAPHVPNKKERSLMFFDSLIPNPKAGTWTNKISKILGAIDDLARLPVRDVLA